ncbi:haloacid dehalogenase [Spirochaetia bacterium]|nr:haloacid dehalogenase [Spirochaetia bacterium]
MIKAVVFDYGGVICFPPSPENEEALGRLIGLSVESLRELNRKYRGEYDRGTYNSRDYYKFILSEAGIFPDDASLERIGQTDMDSWKRLNPDTVQLMRDIKAAGFTLGILSNMPHDFLAWGRQNIPVFNEADPAIFSCDFNLIKPEAAIYEKMRELTGCAFEEIVFFDDIPNNIAMAGKLGIRGIIWEGPEAARETLKKIDKGFEVL